MFDFSFLLNLLFFYVSNLLQLMGLRDILRESSGLGCSYCLTINFWSIKHCKKWLFFPKVLVSVHSMNVVGIRNYIVKLSICVFLVLKRRLFFINIIYFIKVVLNLMLVLIKIALWIRSRRKVQRGFGIYSIGCWTDHVTNKWWRVRVGVIFFVELLYNKK